MHCVEWDQTIPAEDYFFAGPIAKRMTAEQFVDALWQLIDGAPAETANDPLFIQAASQATDGDQRPRVRASLVVSTPLMRTLGRPNREQTVTTRPAELTTLEAIALSNGEPLATLLDTGAERLLSSHSDSCVEDICKMLFIAALSREPTDEELSQLVGIAGQPLTKEGLSDAMWCLVMQPEFQLVQ